MIRGILVSLFFLCFAEARADTWSVFIYWAVDNDLYQFSIPYLQQFEKVGSNENLNLIAQVDYPGRTRLSERIKIGHFSANEPNPNRDLPHSRTIETLRSETHSASKDTLAEFLVWGYQHYPADHVILVIGSHGMNWRGIIEDEHPNEILSLHDLNLALAPLQNLRDKPLELLIFDACRMAFVDTLLNLKDRATYILGSQFDVNGFDHATPLYELAQNPNLNPRALGAEYIKAYPHPDHSIPNFAASLLKSDSKSQDTLDEAIRGISKTFESLSETNQYVLKHLLKITENEYQDRAVDLGDLTQALSTLSPSPLTQELARHFRGATTHFDSMDHSRYLADYPDRSPIEASSATGGSSPASGLAMNCPRDLRLYGKSLMGILHPEWIRLCSILFK